MGAAFIRSISSSSAASSFGADTPGRAVAVTRNRKGSRRLGAPGVDAGGELRLDEGLVEAAGAALSEHGPQDVERVEVRVLGRRDLVGERHDRERAGLVHGDAPLAALLGLGRVDGRRRRDRREGAEVLADQVQRLLGLEVPDDHDRGVVRPVVGRGSSRWSASRGICSTSLRQPMTGQW